MAIKYPDYNNSILNVSNTFLKYYGIDTNYSSISILEDELQSKPDHIIYVLLDGMGANIVNKLLDDKDALKKYMKKEITSVFPPTTVAATNSVLSGLPPISSGYLGWVQYFKEENTDLTVFLNKDFYDQERSFDYNLRDKYLSYKNITTQIKEKNPHIESTILFPKYIGGTTDSFMDAIEQALLIAHNQDQSFTYLYWTEPDLTEHKNGIYSDETRKMLKGLNNDFEELLDNLPNNTLVTVIADHGLTDVQELNIYQFESLMSHLERKPSIEPRAINFFVKDGHKNDFYNEFKSKFDDIYKIYTRDEIFESNIFGIGEKHPLVDMFVGDFIAIAISNVLFSINDVKSYKAHHAGLLEDEMMVPLIIYKK